jgi:two-component system response regulator DegU
MSGETRQKTRIFLADGQHMVCQGIRQLLEREMDFEVIGEADNSLDAVRLARELRPDIIIMEARMPKLDGVEVIRQGKAERPEAIILILTMYDEEEYVVELIRAGAACYLLKSTYGEQLVQAIRFVLVGEFVCHPAGARKLVKHAARRLPLMVNSAEHLTPW